MRGIDVNVPATAVVGGRNVPGRVLKLSPGFALFAGPLTMTPGSLLELRIDGIDQVLHVRFVESANGGVYLQLPLNHAHLTHMAQVMNRLSQAAAA